MSRYVTIGLDANSNKEITIGDIEWRSGLYIVGRSGMGKTHFLVHLATQAIKTGMVYFSSIRMTELTASQMRMLSYHRILRN